MRLRGYVVAALSLALLLALAACASEGASHSDGQSFASCAARLLVDGDEYTGMGGLVRDPETTGEEIQAVMPGCSDTNAVGIPPDETVAAQVLAGIEPDTALFFDAAIYIREGRLQDEQLQERLRYWRTEPTCDSAGTFTLVGGWLGVKGAHDPEHDGDIQLPYRVLMHVDAGPAAYVRTQLTVHASTRTDPALGPDDVTASLWKGGAVTAEVRCEGDRFSALTLRSSPP